jgi:hypothetical protein
VLAAGETENGKSSSSLDPFISLAVIIYFAFPVGTTSTGPTCWLSGEGFAKW